MTTQQFLAKQRVKYMWKALRQNVRHDQTEFNDQEVADEVTVESFWEYEQTPRTL